MSQSLPARSDVISIAMTSSAPSANLALSSDAIPTRVNADRRADIKAWSIACLIIAAIFLLVENPYWVPGGDSEVYLGSAINLAKGNGYLFNGQPTRIAPPGWPMLLALVIKYISPTFIALKLMTLASMLGALATFYWVLRRFATPKTCAVIIVLTSIISHVYSLTFWLHSDALFVWITALTVLLALQISEGRRELWRIVAVLMLCVAGVLVRWAGVINVILIVATLLHGQLWPPRRERTWVTGALVVLVTFGSLFAIRFLVHHFAPPRSPFEESADMDLAAVPPPDVGEGGNVGSEPSLITGTAGRSGYVTRFIGFGTWYSFLLWQPFRMAGGIRMIWWAATLTGWIVIAIVLVAAWQELLARRWLLPATVFYTFALCMNWPHATARYLVPITPLILLLIVRGLDLLIAAAAKDRWRRLAWKTVGIVGLGSVVLCNLMLYGIDVWVMRAGDFYSRYEAGMDKSLIAAAEYLNNHRVGNWQTCVNTEYKNLNKRRLSDTSLRILSMLTGKAMLTVPKKYLDGPFKIPGGREFRKEVIARNRVRYYLEQPPISPWRVWHFRMGWMQKLLTGQEPIDTGAGWKLYRCNGAETPVLVDLPKAHHSPRRIPGFDNRPAAQEDRNWHP